MRLKRTPATSTIISSAGDLERRGSIWRHKSPNEPSQDGSEELERPKGYSICFEDAPDCARGYFRLSQAY